MEKLFILWITLIPLITWNSYYEVPKVFIFLVGCIFLSFVLILNFKIIKFNKRDVWYLVWLLALFFSGLLSDDFKTSLMGGSYRHQGILFFFGLWMAMKYKELLNKSNIKLLYKGMAIIVIIQSLIVIFGNKLGTIGEINAVSGFISIGIYFVFTSFKKYLALFPIVVLFINFSKSAFLSLIPFILNKSKIRVALLTLGLVIIFTIKPIENLSAFENRQVIWKHAINLILERPILGYGAESNEVLFKQSFYESGFPLSNLIIDRSHNFFLDITLWSGVLGLICFLMFLKEVFISLDNYRKKAFMSFLIYSMFQPLSIVHLILFVLIV